MKFNIAAKLGLLVAVVSLVATGVVGLWSMGQARTLLTEQELDALIDEAQIRVYELINDFRYLRRDGRDLAGRLRTDDYDAPSMVKKLLDARVNPDAAPDAAKKAAATFLATFRRKLEEPDNSHYLEVAVVPVEDGDPVVTREPLVAVGRRVAGGPLQEWGSGGRRPAKKEFLSLLDGKSLSELLNDTKQPGRNPKRATFPTRSFPFIDEQYPDGHTPLLLTVTSPISKENTGLPDALLILTVDFAEFVRYRTGHLPHHLVYLTDAKGGLLVHPLRHRQHELAALARNGVGGLPALAEEVEAFRPLMNEFARKTREEQRRFRLEQGAEIASVTLTDMAFALGTQRFERDDDREMMRRYWTKVRDDLFGLNERFPEMRFQVPSAASTSLKVSTPSAKDLALIQQEIDALRRKRGWAPPSWSPPVFCKTFAVRLMFVNPDLDARDTFRGVEEGGEEPPLFFGLVMATGLENVQQGVVASTGWMVRVVLILAAGAALLAWIFSRYLTQSLKRIIRATQHIAEGSIDSEPPEPLPLTAKDEIGILARSFENMRDQLKKRREALYETIARMRAVLDTAAEGIVIFDEHGVIESFNQAAEQIFGHKASEIHGQKVDRLMSITLAAATTQTLPGASDSVRMVSQVVRTRGEVTGRRKDGSTFPMEVAFSEVPLQGRKVVTGIFRDITERKKAEEAIKRANEELDARVRLRTFELEDAMGKLEAALQGAVEATRAKDSFLASMSHELRTPLNAIIGYTELMMEEACDEGYESLVPDLTKVHSAGKHLLELINDILDLSKIAAGQMKLNLTDFELKPLVEAIQGMGKPLAQQYGNELVVAADPALGRMHADEKRVRQILLNLLSNACKFTDKGRITLRARRESGDDGRRIILEVQDTGIGMTPEQSRRLGELFYQVDASNTRKKGGTGLGMAITKNFIRMMNGTLSIHSEPGKGTTFTVSLPVHVEPGVEPPPESVQTSQQTETSPMPSSSRDLVLVVDDDPEARDMLKRFLTKEGLRVHLAESGKDIVPLARHLRPVAITLDVRMPGLDGWTLLAALKTDPTTADIPVIMLTIEDNAKRGFALGASDYLTKPIDWPRLAAVLHKYCRAVDSAPVLVVEDDPVSRELVCRMLQREGRMAVPAENGLVALERLNAGLRPALILLDLMMPEMDGFEFIEEVGRRPQLQGVPIVVVTAKELSPADRERLNGHVMQVLSKGSFTPEQLLMYLRDRVQQHMHPGAGGQVDRGSGVT